MLLIDVSYRLTASFFRIVCGGSVFLQKAAYLHQNARNPIHNDNHRRSHGRENLRYPNHYSSNMSGVLDIKVEIYKYNINMIFTETF
jgi:hypothetical protein